MSPDYGVNDVSGRSSSLAWANRANPLTGYSLASSTRVPVALTAPSVVPGSWSSIPESAAGPAMISRATTVPSSPGMAATAPSSRPRPAAPRRPTVPLRFDLHRRRQTFRSPLPTTGVSVVPEWQIS